MSPKVIIACVAIISIITIVASAWIASAKEERKKRKAYVTNFKEVIPNSPFPYTTSNGKLVTFQLRNGKVLFGSVGLRTRPDGIYGVAEFNVISIGAPGADRGLILELGDDVYALWEDVESVLTALKEGGIEWTDGGSYSAHPVKQLSTEVQNVNNVTVMERIGLSPKQRHAKPSK